MSEMNAGGQQVLGRDPSDRILPTRYDAQISQLRLPEQDALKNDAERCSADPRAMNALGRAIGHQVRITRKDDSRFVALYTVKQANPETDLNDPARATVLRTGLLGGSARRPR